MVVVGGMALGLVELSVGRFSVESPTMTGPSDVSIGVEGVPVEMESCSAPVEGTVTVGVVGVEAESCSSVPSTSSLVISTAPSVSASLS